MKGFGRACSATSINQITGCQSWVCKLICLSPRWLTHCTGVKCILLMWMQTYALNLWITVITFSYDPNRGLDLLQTCFSSCTLPLIREAELSNAIRIKDYKYRKCDYRSRGNGGTNRGSKNKERGREKGADKCWRWKAESWSDDLGIQRLGPSQGIGHGQVSRVGFEACLSALVSIPERERALFI